MNHGTTSIGPHLALALITTLACSGAPPRLKPLGVHDCFGAQASKVTGTDYFPARQRLALGFADGKLALLSVSSGALESCSAHRAPVTDVAFSSDGSRLASVDAQGRLTLWNMADGDGRSFDFGEPLGGVAWTPGSTTVAVASQAGEVILWTEEGARKASLQLDQPIFDVAFHPSGETLLAAGSSLTFLATHPGRDTLVPVARVPLDHPALEVSYSPTGDVVAILHSNGASLWSTAVGDLRAMQAPADPWEPLGIRFDGSGGRLAVFTSTQVWVGEVHPYLPIQAGAQTSGSGIVDVRFTSHGELVAIQKGAGAR